MDLRQLRSAFFPHASRQIDWFRIVHRLSAAKTAGTEVLRRYLHRRAELVQRKNRQKEEGSIGEARPSTGRPSAEGEGANGPRRRRSRGVQQRDSIIQNGLEEGLDRLEVCQRPDDKGVPTTGKMRRLGCRRWEDAWTSLELRNNVQQVFSKTPEGPKSVKG